MEFRTFDIEGPLELLPRKIEDERGYFSEVFRLAAFTERAGPVEFVQDNQSLSVRKASAHLASNGPSILSRSTRAVRSG